MPAPGRAKEIQSIEERIQLLAYQLYLDRGQQPGADVDDWLRAEAEILREDEIDESSEESFPASDPPAR